jgi:type I restriction enzyme R subunit
MSRITEKRDVQDQLINYLIGIGWKFIGQYELPKWRNNDEKQPFLEGVLRDQLVKLNEWSANDGRVDEVVRKLYLLSPTVEGNEIFLSWLRGTQTAYDRAKQREFNVTLIDYESPENNTFHFTEEMWFEDRDRRRMDMVLFINGLPVLLIENKSPKLEDPGMVGFDQVQDTYTRFIPEFIKYPIPFAICASRLEYGATWNNSVKAFYRWKTETKDFGLEDLCKTFFSQNNTLNLLRDYTIFYRNDDTIQKFLLRPHQIRTVEKITDRVVTGQTSLDAPDTGLEWHTQGSGKTLTMIVAASLLRRQSQLENPTLLIVVDRLELEGQMLQNLEAYGFPVVTRARNKDHLRELLESDYRGLIVTTIHKFDRLAANVCDRRNVVILIDEAHRSQEGDLGIYMRAALPHAFQFGFTGTPINKGKIGQGTFQMFGLHDPEGYHDKYSINESIEDKTTVPLFYTLAPTKIWVDKLKLEGEFSQLLEEFFAMVEEEGAGTQEALSRLLKKADKLMAVLKSPQRISAIALHIATHFQENVLPLGFKAIVVTPDREACALYKQAFNELLPKEWSVPVYSEDKMRDSDLMRSFYLDEDEEKRVRKAFRNPDAEPKLLIVTEKLLTGYDAPVAYCMYLDKPLKDHTLLQAIARVNRPYTNKDNGLVVDYIGVFANLQRALSFDQASISKGLIDLEVLKGRFVQLLEQAFDAVAPIQPTNPEGRIDRIIKHFFIEETREAFVGIFEELQSAYEILSPDAFLRPYIDDYALIADIYQTVYSYFDPKAQQRRFERDLLKKTEKLIKEHVEVSPVVSPLPLYPINKNIADVIKADNISEQVKVINLQRSLITHIQDNMDEQPFLVTIGEEVERVIEQLRQRQITAETALAELRKKAEQVANSQEEQAESNLDNLAFSLRMVLRASEIAQNMDGSADTLSTELSQYLKENEGWRFNGQLKSKVRLEIYRRLMPFIQPFNPQRANAIVDDLMKMHGITG